MLGLFCLLWSTQAFAVTVEGDYLALNSHFEYLTDPEGKLSLKDVLRPSNQRLFTSSEHSKPPTSYQAVWLKVTLAFTEATQEKQYFLFGRVGNFFDLRLYRPNSAGEYDEWITGMNYPSSTREVDAQRYGFFIEPAATPTTIYIRYSGGPGTENLPWDLVEKFNYISKSHTYYSIEIACLAAIAALLCFNLIIAISLRARNHFYYSLYVSSVMMGLLTVDGIGFQYLWPDTPSFNERSLHTFNLLSASLRLLAIASFLDIARTSHPWNLATKYVLGMLAACLVVVNVVGITQLPPYFATWAWAAGILFGFAICIHGVRAKKPLAMTLLITLLIPSLAALLQAVLVIGSQAYDMLEIQIAKLGFVVHVMMFSLCLAAQIKIQAQSHIVALHDSLTGLPGKRMLAERFEWATQLSQRQDWKMAVLFLDLDGFKAVNDTLGHSRGDQLLVQASARMEGVLRQTDFIARSGGDEFVILLLELENQFTVVPVVEKLLEAVAKPYHLDEKEARISASIGVAYFPDHGRDLATLIKAADAAMYTAKEMGKSTYSIAPQTELSDKSQGEGSTEQPGTLTGTGLPIPVFPSTGANNISERLKVLG